nr:uncharacterized protein LOC111840262 isoform X2 [Paramormyrops kingsleyae]XP_023660677.1 uncharacterized protein LOC111840262 isoform X2 [Paramormyrops kingsleyae]
MYLGTANNNLASTTLRFFNQAVQQYGFPLRVRGDHGNDECGCCQVDVHSTGNRKGQLQYIAGKSVHNQRIERLWRDVWMGVTWTFYNLLHNLEEQGNLDISDSVHLFCCHYVFIPRLQTSLHVFCCGWDDHPLRSEGNMTPNQLWEVGQMQNPIPDPVGLEELHIPNIDWEDSIQINFQANYGVTVPELRSPLTEEQLNQLSEH